MDDASQRKELSDRLESLRAAAKLPAFADREQVVDKISAAGVSTWFHATISDSDVIDKMILLQHKSPELFGAGDLAPGANANSAEVEWIKAKYPDFRTMSPGLKLAIHQKYLDTLKKPPADRAPGFRKVLEARHGSVEKAPAVDRLTLAEMEGTLVREKAGSYNGRSTLKTL
jgi:hypothetical protein